MAEESYLQLKSEQEAHMKEILGEGPALLSAYESGDPATMDVQCAHQLMDIDVQVLISKRQTGYMPRYKMRSRCVLPHLSIVCVAVPCLL